MTTRVVLAVATAWLCAGAARAVGVVGVVGAVGAVGARPPPADGPERPLCPPPPARCRVSESSRDEHFYTVDDKRVLIQFLDGKYFKLQCPENVTLESKSLPRFSRRVHVLKLKVHGCPPPSGSYAAALGALNVTVLEELALEATPTAPALRAHHFARLRLRALSVEAKVSSHNLRPAHDFLERFATLTDLRLYNVLLQPPALLLLPKGLRALHLVNVGVEELPAAVFARLTSLQGLVVRDNDLHVAPSIEVAPSLRDLFISEPLADLPSLRHVENATLYMVKRPTLWDGCAELQRLIIAFASVNEFPEKWLLNCSQLKELKLERLEKLETLPSTLLSGAHSLQSLTIRYCPLRELPVDLLVDARKLRWLNLSHNQLNFLPSGIFSTLSALEELDVSHNKLSSKVGDVVGTLTSLRKLSLGHNPLGDLCAAHSAIVSANVMSSLSLLTRLQELSLAGSGATRVCPDWRTDLRALRTLDLARNNLTRLHYSDLQFLRDVPAVVNLQSNPITAIVYKFSDYEAVLQADKDVTQKVRVVTDARLECDCESYWFAAAERARRGHSPLGALRCRGGRALAATPPAALTCALPPAACPRACACRRRAPDNATLAACAAPAAAAAALAATATDLHTDAHNDSAGAPLALWVERAGLRELPPLGARLLELHAAHNQLRELRPHHLPHALRVLDVRNNSLARVGAAAAAALFARRDRAVLLGANPLPCDCALRPLLLAARAHQDQVLDYENVTCADGRPVRALEPEGLCGAGAGAGVSAGVGAGAAAGVLAVLALAAGAGAALARHRGRLKAFLYARGLCLRWVVREDRDDEAKRYDAFVSFSHRDGEWVQRELVAPLESGPRPYRLCVHYRDWAPGEWIPAQIAASVRDSRRTILVLSEHFAASAWARAEFRAAHAAALRAAGPRLIVVKLGPVSTRTLHALDPDLRAFLDNNTYVAWGDPWFWDKLRYALPHRRADADADAAPAPAPTPGAAPRPPPTTSPSA